MFFGIVYIVCAFFAHTSGAFASDLTDRFLPGSCRMRGMPVFIVADATRSGEIDDSISLTLYRELEKRGCIRVIGIASIFGNGGSSTGEIHTHLTKLLSELGIREWKLFRGPDGSSFGSVSEADGVRLALIASAINKEENGVVIAELGPMTVSARLLMHRMVDPGKIRKILAIGGRSKGERFTTGRKFGSWFAFRDMNVAEDTRAAAYLLTHCPDKLWMVTYRTAIGARAASPALIASSLPVMASHAYARGRIMEDVLGYEGIPLWDAFTTSYFLEGGEARVGCRKTRAAMRYAGATFRDRMQLWLDLPEGEGSVITACHDAKF